MPTQAVFTPSGGSAINLNTFPLETKFDNKKIYRLTDPQGLLGCFAIFLREEAVPVETVVVGLAAVYDALKAAENMQGSLNVRGTTFSYVKLMNAEYVGLLNPTVTPGTPLSVSGASVMVKTTWIKEPS